MTASELQAKADSMGLPLDNLCALKQAFDEYDHNRCLCRAVSAKRITGFALEFLLCEALLGGPTTTASAESVSALPSAAPPPHRGAASSTARSSK